MKIPLIAGSLSPSKAYRSHAMTAPQALNVGQLMKRIHGDFEEFDKDEEIHVQDQRRERM